MAGKLHISADLSLPLEFVTQTQAILARKRVGKSYTASVQAEEMLKAKQQVLVIDYTGAWWGLRAGRDAKPDGGYPIHVFGGDHADVPLEERAGEVIATAAVKERFSAILDLSHFRKGEALRFLAPFLETLYRLNRDALHLFADECDAYAPQRTFAVEDARTLGAMNDIVRRGGIRGIGCTLISQRPAVINKDILTMCGVLTALRISHPKDIAPVRDWIELHDEGGQADEMIKSLPSLPIGTCWVWAPGWPDEVGIFKRVKVRERETFDSGATPKPGQSIKTPKVLRPVDLEKLGASIKQTAEQARENDPKALRAELAKLRGELEQLRRQPAATKVERVEVPVLPDAQIRAVEKVVARLEAEGTKQRESGETLLSEAREMRASIGRASVKPPVIQRPPAPQPAARPVPRREVVSGEGGISRRQQRMLDAAATLETLGASVSRESVCAWIGVHPRGGSVGEELKALSDAGMVVVEQGRITLTDAGRAAATQLDPAGAIESAKSGLSPRQTRIFDIVTAAYPEPVAREAIAAQMGIHPRGGSFGEDIGRLAGRGLVESSRGTVRAKDFLFGATK